MNNSLPPNTDAAPAELIQLGHYELHDCIGRGGMGLVYRARDTRLDRQVAIKCLRTELFEHHYVERFKREALLLAKLNHPNIVQIYDFIEAPDQLALVMELVEGQNLQLHLREHIVPFAQRMRWLTEIAQGLAVAHDAGIIHRDLKAENILINQRQVAKITDLGIAKSQDYNATLTDHVAGSYCSMSPEQAMGEAIDFKSDLFSFGILAYQLLCGAHPFGDTNNKLQLMQRIISHPPIAPGKHNPNLPAEINDLLGQLLSKDPAKRPDNTHWVAAQFEALSHIQLQNEFVSDETQALIPNGSAANQSNVKHTGIKSAVKTQDHPTFETRFVAVNVAPKKSRWLSIKNYLLENKISVSFGVFSVLLLAAVGAWQLQPKPPKYVAVIPPKLTAEGMQESQQELVKGAVYDAIQQSVIQLDGYYLIPIDEIAAINAENSKEGIETIRLATAADEIITTAISCKIEACSITFSRLVADNNNSNRLRSKNVKTVDILSDNYLSVATITSRNIGDLYSIKINNNFQSADDNDYSRFIEINNTYRLKGASQTLLDAIDQLKSATKKTASVQKTYREISLDLYIATRDASKLDALKEFLSANPNRLDEASHLYNLYNLQLIEGDFEQALETAKKLATSRSIQDELVAHILLEKGEYQLAIESYKKSLTIKKTAYKLFSLANAFWLIGNNSQAKKYLNESLALSPSYHKSLGLVGLIALTEGNLNQAIISSQALINQKPDDITAINNLGLSYLLKKDYSKAFELFKAASNNAPQNNTYLINMADAKNLSGDTENRELYQKLIKKINSEQVDTQNLRYRSQAYAHMGDFSEALNDLQELEKTDPQNIETIYTAALVHTLANNKSSAILNIEKSLKHNMNKIWFSFSWFSSLCHEPQFLLLMESEDAPCHPHLFTN